MALLQENGAGNILLENSDDLLLELGVMSTATVTATQTSTATVGAS